MKNIKEENDKIIKPMLHQMAKLDMREAEVMRQAGITSAIWHRVRNNKASPKLHQLNSIAKVLGLEIRITRKSNENTQNT